MRAAAGIAEKGAEGFQKFQNVIANTDAAEQAKIRLDNLAGSWEMFLGTVSVVMTNF